MIDLSESFLSDLNLLLERHKKEVSDAIIKEFLLDARLVENDDKAVKLKERIDFMLEWTKAIYIDNSIKFVASGDGKNTELLLRYGSNWYGSIDLDSVIMTAL